MTLDTRHFFPDTAAMNTSGLRRLSLKSRSARSQLAVATALVLVIPLLSFAFIAVSSIAAEGTYSRIMHAVICVMALLLGLAGYFMLRHYPRNMESLRGYLKDIASGELPDEIRLGDDVDDVSAIARYLNMILLEMRKKVELLEIQLAKSRKMHDTIEAQAEELLEAERHRVMIETLGTACHHIGQPATVLRLYLDSMRNTELSGADRQKFDECQQAIESIAEILRRLRNVSEYRTIPYQTYHHNGFETSDRILDIDQ